MCEILSIQPVNVNKINIQTPQTIEPQRKNISFKGGGDVMLAVMDSMERGGFAASFVVQDMLGMAFPRVITGFSRNKNETGEKNVAFATSEALREFLSGPSMFIIPSVILYAGTKIFGKASKVGVDFINGMGKEFEKYSKTLSKEALVDKNLMKKDFYKKGFINLLNASTDNKIENAEKIAEEFAKKTIEIENAPKKGFFRKLVGKEVKGSSEDLADELMNDFIKIKKRYLSADDRILTAKFLSDGKKPKILTTSFEKFTKDLKNYTEDITSTLSKKASKNKLSENISDFVNKFNLNRIGKRFATTTAMTLALFSFTLIIPKLYKNKKGNPGLVGVVPAEGGKNENK